MTSASKASGQHATKRMHQSRNFTISTAYTRDVAREFRENSRMKSYRKELWFEVKGRRGFVNTPQIIIEQLLNPVNLREVLKMRIIFRIFP